MEAAGLRPGDELRAEVIGPGEIRFVRVLDPLEVWMTWPGNLLVPTRPAISMS